MIKEKYRFSFETNQAFWHLALILSAGFGLESSLLGGRISKDFGIGTAIPSILIGNFILWFIGLGIVSMNNHKTHTIQSVKENFGKIPSVIAAIVTVSAFLLWYALHIKAPTDSLSLLIKEFTKVNDTFDLRISAILGFTCALISIGSIKVIKWVNIISFPFLLFFIALIVMKSNIINPFEESWVFSGKGIIPIVITWLPGTVNLSTFFRHSRSKQDSILGLSLMMIFHSTFQIAFALLNISSSSELITNNILINKSFYLPLVTIFIFISFLCVNLLNVYWASIGWEVFFKRKHGSKEYAIIGLIGTVIYIFFQSTETINYLQDVGTICISNLGVILITGFLAKSIIKHRVRLIDKISNSVNWFISSLITITILFSNTISTMQVFIVGIAVCLFVFGFTIFIEEMGWAVKYYKKREN